MFQSFITFSIRFAKICRVCGSRTKLWIQMYVYLHQEFEKLSSESNKNRQGMRGDAQVRNTQRWGKIICNFGIPSSSAFLCSKINSVSVGRRWKIHFSTVTAKTEWCSKRFVCFCALKFCYGRVTDKNVINMLCSKRRKLTDNWSCRERECEVKGNVENKINELKFILSEFVWSYSGIKICVWASRAVFVIYENSWMHGTHYKVM